MCAFSLAIPDMFVLLLAIDLKFSATFSTLSPCVNSTACFLDRPLKDTLKIDSNLLLNLIYYWRTNKVVNYTQLSYIKSHTWKVDFSRLLQHRFARLLVFLFLLQFLRILCWSSAFHSRFPKPVDLMIKEILILICINRWILRLVNILLFAILVYFFILNSYQYERYHCHSAVHQPNKQIWDLHSRL